MRVYRYSLISLVMLLGMVGAVLATSMPAPTQAQQVFVTNTPRPPDVMTNNPAGRVDQYALRLWTEQDMIDLLLSQLDRLARGETAQADAIRYTMFELDLRFPGAPRDRAQRERVLRTILQAPRGSVDLRTIARPYLVDVFNQAIPVFPAPIDPITVEGFRFTPSPANFNPDELEDVLLQVAYVGINGQYVDDPYYMDVIPLIAGEGAYQLVTLPRDMPAFPYNETRSLSVLTIDDINTDSLDEFVLLEDTGGANWQVRVYGWRNDAFVELVEPGQQILTGSPTNVTITNGEIRVQPRQVESERWNCQSSIPVSWVYRSNLYREEIAYNAAYTNLDTLGCTLAETDPAIFLRPPAGAIPYVSGVLATGDVSAQGYRRGAMALALLYVLDGQTERALEYLDEIEPLAADSVWLRGQIDALRAALPATEGTVEPLAVCAALLAENPDGACDIDRIIERQLIDNPIARSGDLRGQLELMGLPVREVINITQVGQAPRDYVLFDFNGVSWWAFAPTAPDFYVPELTSAPAGYTAPLLQDTTPLSVPVLALNALIEERDPLTALTILDNEQQNAPTRPLATEARFFQALSLEIQGEREQAKTAYYQLWEEASDTPWGPLAGYHLEPRGIDEG